jgi:SET domain-containing protein 6
LVLDFEVELPDAMISLIRLLMMPADQWTKARDKGKVLRHTLDDAILRIVQEVLDKRLAMYRTSIMVRTSGTYLLSSCANVRCRKTRNS